ncbi:MAG: TIGR02301 family protein [Hyphomonadaceae bacterium]
MSLRPILAAMAALLFASPALAQDPPPAAAPIELLSDLAETLGRAHAVRTVCNGDDDSTWRNYMLNLMSMEAPSGSPRRATLTDAFNRGYRTQARETSACTDKSPAIEARIAKHGRELADAIAKSYLN